MCSNGTPAPVFSMNHIYDAAVGPTLSLYIHILQFGTGAAQQFVGDARGDRDVQRYLRVTSTHAHRSVLATTDAGCSPLKKPDHIDIMMVVVVVMVVMVMMVIMMMIMMVMMMVMMVMVMSL
jgi:hypothetical protein